MPLQVFISYKREYETFARKIKSRVQEWGYGTWFDIDDIAEGTYFRHAIQHGLESSNVMVGILTEDAFRSREVQAEWDYFFIKEKEFIPLRYQAIEPPYHLLAIQYIDFITDEAAAFEKLHKRLGVLASKFQVDVEAQKPKPGAPAAAPAEIEVSDALADWFPASDDKPLAEPIEQAPTLDEKERKKEALDDGIFGLPPPAPPPSPITRPPSPITRPEPVPQSQAPAAEPLPQADGYGQPSTNAPVMQPQRQQSGAMPQPSPISRKRSSPLIWPLAAASVVVVLGAVALVVSNANITAFATPEAGTSPWVWVGVLALVGVVGFGLWWVFNRRQKKSAIPYETEHTISTPSKVDWETIVLQASLEPVSLTIISDALLRHKEYGDYMLPANTDMLQVFEDANRELLILGTAKNRDLLLRQLAYKLAQEAAATGAIPLLLNLSSRNVGQSLEQWLADELKARYQMPVTQMVTWIKDERLALLLDGLDEIAEPHRKSCVDAINTFRQQHPKIDWVVCSRASDFDHLTSTFDVSTAVIIPTTE